ncbi:MAG: DUF4194 domain-containing protein, partial [Anaeroplasmataceae bacterium]
MLENYELMSVTQKNSFKDISNKLLTNTFICKNKENNKNDYYFVLNFKDSFEEFFKVLDYDLIVDNATGVIMLEPNNNASVLKLKKEQTIILLLLRIIYHEKLKEVSLNENVTCSNDDIVTKYNYLEV